MSTLTDLSNEFNFDAMMLYFRTGLLQHDIHLRHKQKLIKYKIINYYMTWFPYNSLSTIQVYQSSLV